MSALVVAVLNRKGGAGKTSLTKDLGFALAVLGVRVLQVGLDPQSSLEVLAGLGSDTPPERTVSRLLMPEEFRDAGALEDVVHQSTRTRSHVAAPLGTCLRRSDSGAARRAGRWSCDGSCGGGLLGAVG